MTVIRADAPGHEWVRVGKDDGATRIWVAGGTPLPQGLAVGLHRHAGDEIFQVLAGRVRFHVDGRNVDVGEGSFVVVPPHTQHGFKILTDQATIQFIGEFEMGEWVTVVDPDGARREVEVRTTMMPWHRPPADGVGTDIGTMMAMLAATNDVFDVEPDGTGPPP